MLINMTTHVSTHVKVFEVLQKITAVRCCGWACEYKKKNGVGNELTFGICLVCMPPLLLPSLLSEKLSRRESREGTTYGNSFTVYLNILRMYYILVEHHNHTGTLVHCCF